MANYGGATIAEHQQAASGLFRDEHSTERAYDLLMDKGDTREETSGVMSEERRKAQFDNPDGGAELSDMAIGGVSAGRVIDGLLGALRRLAPQLPFLAWE